MHIIITASPNAGGLTAACGQAALEGVRGAGGKAEIIDISAAKLEPCRVCGNGWGTCREGGECVIGDILGEIQTKLRDAEGVVLVTPVYFGQPSERMKYFLDRFRRCEAFKPDCATAGKPVHMIAAAGGSGNGTATALSEMQEWCRHVGANPCERIGVSRFSREPMMGVIRDAGARLVSGKYFKRAL
jgi:multimeric flavodoxin WrbA